MRANRGVATGGGYNLAVSDAARRARAWPTRPGQVARTARYLARRRGSNRRFTLTRYVRLDYQHLPQKALGYCIPRKMVNRYASFVHR